MTTAGSYRTGTPSASLERARALVLRHGWNAMAYQILNPGLRHWFSAAADSEAVIGYVSAGRCRVVAGAPVCPPERLAETAAEFAAEAERAGDWVCYFGAQDRLIEVLAEHGPTSVLLLGAQPAWNPRSWPAVIDGKASLRAQLARARNKNVTVHPWPAAVAAKHHAALERCLSEWLERRGLPPMHFLVEWNVLSHLFDRRLFVAERAGQAIGFLIASPIPLRNGWLIEQIIRGRAAPNGTAELLLDTAIRLLAAEGAGYVTLGLSPLSRAVRQEPPPPWRIRAVLAWVRAHGKRFYNFEGLEQFKSKFQPEEWEPIYAVTNRPRISMATLHAIAGAFGGTSPVLFIGRALLRALRQEARWASRGSERGKKNGAPGGAPPCHE